MPTILRPDEVRSKYGPMFCKGLYTIVDEKNGLAKIIETCSARGPIEWDTVNRKRTGGVIYDMRLDGYTLTMDAKLGEQKLNFGPASSELGGQGIESITVEGDRVHTKGRGIAGAGVGVGVTSGAGVSRLPPVSGFGAASGFSNRFVCVFLPAIPSAVNPL